MDDHRLPDGTRPATLLAQAGGFEDAATGALVPPLVAASTYLRDPDNGYRRGLSYGRDDNPTVRVAEGLIRDLEGGADALLFASGMAAATALFEALPAGAHVVAPEVMYWGLRHWLRARGPRLGLEVGFVPTHEPGALQAALRPGKTRLVWVETPANPLLHVTDLAAAAGLARAAGALLAVDNTVPTPLGTRPLELGADLVMHSATKALNGHGDVLGGALVVGGEAAAGEVWAGVKALRHDGGAILGPFEAWLLIRGLRTLHLRVRAANGNAMHVAAALGRHPRVERVLYPGLPTHPGHLVAARQMAGGFGALLSVLVRGGEVAAVGAAACARVWKRATSLGGVESLIEHRASVEGPGSPAPPHLLRLAVGCEDAGDLVDDLDRALRAAKP